jgi:predicted Zn-dependent protease
MTITRRSALQKLMALGLVSCCGCRTTPITGRKQLLLMPEDQEVTLGLSAYEEVLQSEPASTNAHYIEMVNRVGNRIAAVSDRPDYDWQFRVIASDQQNAFCLPGGKVAVYEGILPICDNEAGLAVVMSHEIGHALARHGGERMSQNYAVDGVKRAVNYVIRKQDDSRKEMVMQAYGVASNYGVILPYSRKHESEADHMGIMMMAKAGYDPAEAPRFWGRFATMTAGEKPPEFLSTHPSDSRRAADLQALLPDANQLYAAATTQFGNGDRIQLAVLPGRATPPAETGFGEGFVPGGSPPAYPVTYGGTGGVTPGAGQPAYPASYGGDSTPRTAQAGGILGPPIR